ncbi:MAG: hypothetical protein ACJ8D5_04135 [Sphingomicrobium sp.]
MRKGLIGLAAVGALIAAEASAQDAGELTLYSRGHFMGSRLTLTEPAKAMNLPFTVKSVQVGPGRSWELCSGNTFSGCRRFSQSVDGMAMTVRSARPIGVAVAVPGGTVTPAGQFERAPPSPSLRGVSSEFFVAPARGERRIEVRPATGEEALRRASEFCRSIRWGSAGHADLQRAGASAFLVDVLCVR